MVGEEFESGGLDVGFELVKLYTVAVVDKDILVLRDSKVRMVVEKPRICRVRVY